MSRKRECPPSFSPPPLAMPWMRVSNTQDTPSMLSSTVNRPIRSQQLLNTDRMKPPDSNTTQGEKIRIEKANTIRLVSDSPLNVFKSMHAHRPLLNTSIFWVKRSLSEPCTLHMGQFSQDGDLG